MGFPRSDYVSGVKFSVDHFFPFFSLEYLTKKSGGENLTLVKALLNFRTGFSSVCSRIGALYSGKKKCSKVLSEKFLQHISDAMLHFSP